MKKRSWFQRLLRWTGIVAGVVVLFGLGYFVAQSGMLDSLVGGGATTPTGAAQGVNAQRAAAIAQEGSLMAPAPPSRCGRQSQRLALSVRQAIWHWRMNNRWLSR